jgi:hypothetical protein
MRIILDGYDRFKIGKWHIVAMDSCADEVRDALRGGTLYDIARNAPDARVMKGRAPAYAFNLGPVAGDVVVRHAMRGGFLARFVTDVFVAPTRAILDLLNSDRLRKLGVNTPKLVAYAIYPAGPLLRRCDIATREVPHAYDLMEVFQSPLAQEHVHEALGAVAALLGSLARAGAHHSDLNLKNIVLTRDTTPERSMNAFLLDVDRVQFHFPGDPLVARANMQRLRRSLEKRRSRGEIFLSDADIRWLERRTLEMQA